MNATTQAEQTALTITPASAPAILAGPLAGAIQALQAGMTVDQMRGLMDLQRDWESNEARKAYVADMSQFKLNPPEIVKDKLVSFSGTEYKHATLGSVCAAVVATLATYGFSHSWATKQENGIIIVTCKITHRMGHSESTTMEATPDNSGKKNAIQAVASSITYMQRYTLLAACGLATIDMVDDDGSASGPPVTYDSQATIEIWKKRIDAALNQEVLRSTRGMAAEELRAGNDVAGWNEIKVYAANKAASLVAAATADGAQK